MAYSRPKMHPNAQRDARQLLLNAAPLVGEQPGVEELAITLEFSDPEGKQHPSPRGLTYGATMRAYFQFSCPMRECSGGGFDGRADLLSALTKRANGHTGTLACAGVRPRALEKNARCGIELKYTLAIRGKTKLAA